MVLGTGLLVAAPHSGLGGDRLQEFVGDFGPVLLGVMATIAAFRVSTRPGVDPAVQRAWRRLAIAFGCWWLGDLIWFVYEAVLRQHPFPSPADAAYLAFYPCAVWALLSFPSAGRRRTDWMKLGLDALTVLLCAAMGIWYLVVGPTVHDHPGQGLAMVLNFAYPVGDLLLLFGVLANLLRRTTVMDDAFRILVAGVGSLVVADVAFARLSLSGAYDGGGWPDAFWAGAWCLFFLAARSVVPVIGSSADSDGHPAMAGLGRSRPRPTDQPLARLPYLAVALAYVLLLVVGNREAIYPLDGLILGAAAITTVVLVRQVNMIAENGRLMSRLQNLANVDPLTGIPNRRAFFEEAELLFEGSGLSGRRHSILMIDVDYFKDVNDTFGHRAGDRVLSVVAASAKSQLRSADLVGRYGGDELVIALADCSGAAAFAVADRIRSVVAATPIATEDGVVNVTLSIGVAGSEHGEGLLPIMARADLALYDAKRAGRACVREFAADGSVRTSH
ncbi:MAG TPA: diguanylate cyclase [Acidimicrobiia bacterium]|nr:diguanylate cyclase [Acidimicrobiia bacterium]